MPKKTPAEAKGEEPSLATSKVGVFIKSQNANKTPGITGMTANYQRFLWECLLITITKAFNNSLESNCMPPSHRKGTIVLIPNAGKATTYLSNL